MPDSIVVIPTDGPALVEGDAALHVPGHLDGPVRHVARLALVPRPVRDLVYRAVARGRSCELRAPWVRDRFLDVA